MLIESITSEEFSLLREKIKGVIIPIGSVEAHGPHLPLATDLYTIYEISKKLVERIPFFVAPPIYYGLCRSTRDLPGTLSIRGETLKALLLDVMESLYRQGLSHFIILSGHAGGTHNGYLIDAAETFVEKYKDSNILVADIAKLIREISGDLAISDRDSHAGDWETSLMLYLKPDTVKNLDRAFEDYPTFPKYKIVRDKIVYWPSGIWGNPQRASLERGKVMVEKLIEVLVNLLENLQRPLETDQGLIK